MQDKDRIAFLEQLVADLNFKLLETMKKPTIRDQFAMSALAGFTAIEDNRTYSGRGQDKQDMSVEEWQDSLITFDTVYCYKLADAMMEARKSY